MFPTVWMNANGEMAGWYRYMSPGHHPQRCMWYATLRLRGPAIRKITSQGSALFVSIATARTCAGKSWLARSTINTTAITTAITAQLVQACTESMHGTFRESYTWTPLGCSKNRRVQLRALS
ncbi:uncharacterized protein TrAtP1_008145 [Trichoderma atroviride]|uniref:uncharacterized protein n=1 Tax=Hypocrea atroviridis TaxID=63577 RepID=UPI0033199153|nr:hypothetical protein TrAtP1_008145 [Trichoderma atroviride]